MSAVMLFHSRIPPPTAHCLGVSFGPTSDVFIFPPFFLFPPLLISLRLMVFVRSVSNSGERAGGAICGVWRASLLVIIFPTVILDEAKAHCCMNPSCYQGFPVIECVLWGNSSTMGLRETIAVDFLTDNWMKKLVPRCCLVWPLTLFSCRVPHGGSRIFVTSLQPKCE